MSTRTLAFARGGHRCRAVLLGIQRRDAFIDVAAAFNERLIKKMKEKRGLRTYLQEDYE